MSVCAWCHPLNQEPAPLLGKPAENYGICPRCLAVKLAELSDLSTEVQHFPEGRPGATAQPRPEGPVSRP